MRLSDRFCKPSLRRRAASHARRWRSLLVLLLVLGGGAAPAATAQTLEFADRYLNTRHFGSCNTPFKMTGREPAEGRHPVFIYLVGTWESYDNGEATAVIEQMAAQGYVAASVHYPNSTFGNCPTLSARASCVFDGEQAQSAVARLCARERADCSKGIVVGGLSQGAILAILAADHQSQLRAAWAMGAGAVYGGYDLSACVAAGERSLSGERLRVVNGVSDDYFVGLPGGSQGQSELLSGMSCGDGADRCLAGNGSGWIVINDAEVSDGVADHCYLRIGDCSGSQDQLDPLWESGPADWALGASLLWLDRFVEH